MSLQIHCFRLLYQMKYGCPGFTKAQMLEDIISSSVSEANFGRMKMNFWASENYDLDDNFLIKRV